MGTLLECKDLTKSFSGKTAIDHIDLSIESGHIIGLLGPNGSGKTTLIKMINGLLTPTSGTLYYKENPIGVESKRHISYLPDHSYLNMNQRVKEIIAFFQDFYEDFDSERAYDMLQKLNINPNDSLKSMSKGTKEKVQLLHDIGKIGIPDRILNKPEKLTDEEYGIMKSHVTKGAEILKSFTIVDHVEEGALYHHERYDGKGYVHGLKGEEIPINARIIGIADTFDAMTVNRVYRKQLDMAYVIQELKNGRGTQFDPGLVDVMLALIDNGKIDICSLYKEHAHADHSREKEEE